MKTLFIFLLCVSTAFVSAQCTSFFPDYGFDPTDTNLDSKQFAIEFTGVTPPTTTTTGEFDYYAAVDLDGNIVGCGPVSGDGLRAIGNMQVYFECGETIPEAINCDVATCAVCESFQVYYYDSSEGLFYAVLDENDEPLGFPFVDADDNGILDGFGGVDVANGDTDTLVNISISDMSFTELFTLLPVELSAFSGIRTGKSISLAWTTISESGNLNFDVERSTNRGAFEAIGSVAGAGNSNARVDYIFTDEVPLEGTNYYRLRQNDFTGRFSYSEVIVVDFSTNAVSSLRVSPNPVADVMQVDLSGEWAENLQIQLIDQNGKLVAKWNKHNTASFNLGLDKLPAGIYQLWVQDGTRQQTQRVIVR